MSPVPGIQISQLPGSLFSAPMVFFTLYHIAMIAMAVFMAIMTWRFVRAQEKLVEVQERCVNSLGAIASGLEYKKAAQKRYRE